MHSITWLRRLWGLAVIPAVVVALACSFEVSPDNARNPVGEDHTITIDISASSEEPPTSWDWDITVQITDGPNQGASGTCSPSCSGNGDARVRWTYDSNGRTGTDTIQVCVEFEDPSDSGCEQVTKRWFDPSTPTPTATSVPPTLTPTATPADRPNVGGIFGPLPRRETPVPAAPVATQAAAASTPSVRPPSTGDAGLP